MNAEGTNHDRRRDCLEKHACAARKINGLMVRRHGEAVKAINAVERRCGDRCVHSDSAPSKGRSE